MWLEYVEALPRTRADFGIRWLLAERRMVADVVEDKDAATRIAETLASGYQGDTALFTPD